MNPSTSPLEVLRIPSLPYAEGLALQDAWVRMRRGGEIPDRLLLPEHPHVITEGTGTRSEHLLRTTEELAALGIARHRAGRGGDVTYHGPGQIVGYPVLDLKPAAGRRDRRDLHRYLRELEGVLIDVLADWGIEGTRSPGMTGVWTPGGKVAAIGVRVSSGWITSHGFALNLSTDLSFFETIVPCGIRDREVTSIERILGWTPGRKEVEDRIVHHFSTRFECVAVELPTEGPGAAGSAAGTS